MSQPLILLQQKAEPLLDVQEMQLWLEKAVAWGQADSPDAQKDTCLHLSRLRDFLQQLLTHIHNTVSRYREKLKSYLHSYSIVHLVTMHEKLWDLYTQIWIALLLYNIVSKMPIESNKVGGIY